MLDNDRRPLTITVEADIQPLAKNLHLTLSCPHMNWHPRQSVPTCTWKPGRTPRTLATMLSDVSVHFRIDEAIAHAYLSHTGLFLGACSVRHNTKPNHGPQAHDPRSAIHREEGIQPLRLSSRITGKLVYARIAVPLADADGTSLPLSVRLPVPLHGASGISFEQVLNPTVILLMWQLLWLVRLQL